jgi:serine/threonine protein kinase
VALLRSTDVPVAATDDDPRVGTLLCMRYQVRRVVADGGMGRVYEALDMQDKSRVAIKILHAEVALDEIAVERFKREFEVSKLLPHDHIVDVRDFRETDDKSYALAMEFLEGEELRMLLKREKVLAPARLVRMLSQVALGLDEAHSRQLVHRDLKPDNIFLCGTREGDNVKILDFGSVKDKSSMAKKLTVVGTTIGSPFYMAPEQAQGLDTLDARADVWAMAAISYECLTGSVPFQGVNGPSILLAILTKDPVPASVAGKANGNIPTAIDDVLEAALTKNPNIRTKTIGALADALGHAYGLQGTHQEWATTPQAELTARVQRELGRLMSSAQVANMADPFGAPGSLAAAGAPGQAPFAFEQATSSAGSPRSTSSLDEPLGIPKSQPKWLVPALVGAVAVVVGIVAAVLLFR